MHRQGISRGAAAVTASLMAIAYGTAQAQVQDGDEAIVVLADRLEETTPEELESYGSRLETVEGAAIDEAGFHDTAQALQMLVPGLYVAPKNGAFDYVNVSLLGSRTGEVLFTVDGVRMGNRLYTNTSPLDTLPSSMIERIEVLKGGQGLYYGTQAVGGIVNVITKGFTSKFDGSVEAGYDTNDGYHLNGYARGGGGNHFVVAYASHDEARGFQPFRTADYQPSATDRRRGYRVDTVGLKYAWEPSSAFRLSAGYQHTDARVEFAYAEDVAQAFNTRNEDVASLKLDWTPDDRFGLYLKGYWHDWDSTYTERANVLGANGLPTGALTTINDHDPWTFEDRGLNLLGEYRLSDSLALVAGYDFQKYDGRDAVFLIGAQSEEVHAPFAQLKLDAGSLALAAGVRHNMPSDGQSKTVWNVSGRLGLDSGLYVRGMTGTSFRLPDAYELYVIDPCCETGNPDLVAEDSFNSELGVGFEGGGISAELLGFYRKTKNLIDIDYSLPAYPDGFVVNTADSVTAWGAEAVITAQLSDWMGLTLDWTHSEVEARGTSQQIQDIPRDLAKAILTLAEPGGRFGGSAALNYVGKLYDSVGGGIGRVQHGNYALLDIAAWAFLDPAQRHRLGVRLENALDTDYATRITRVRRDGSGTSYPADNRGTPLTVHASYRLSF